MIKGFRISACSEHYDDVIEIDFFGKDELDKAKEVLEDIRKNGHPKLVDCDMPINVEIEDFDEDLNYETIDYPCVVIENGIVINSSTIN